MSDFKTVTRKFVEDFELVSRHYLLAEHGELELAKKAARADIEAATITYAHLADEIRTGKI